MHAAGERTGLPAGSADLVSISLVLHELPQHATRAVIREAYRVLRPQGVLSVMVRLCEHILRLVEWRHAQSLVGVSSSNATWVC